MADKLAAALGILVFLLLTTVWDQIISALPTRVPAAITVIILIIAAIAALLSYAKVNDNRRF